MKKIYFKGIFSPEMKRRNNTPIITGKTNKPCSEENEAIDPANTETKK
jgi:hypothetical protein